MHFTSAVLLTALACEGVLAHPALVPRHKHHAAGHTHQRDVAATASDVTANANTGDANEDVSVLGNTASNAIALVDRYANDAYTMTFTSTATDTRDMVVWNKVGSDGLPSSGSFVSKAVTTRFSLAPGESRVIAFQPNTQAAFCDWTDRKTTAAGQFDCPYGEVNIAPTSTTGAPGWSAADVSTYVQSPTGDGKGVPCNLDIGALGSVTPNSTCESNYYYAAAGSSGLQNGLGVIVNNPDTAHFFTRVSNMGTSS